MITPDLPHRVISSYIYMAAVIESINSYNSPIASVGVVTWEK